MASKIDAKVVIIWEHELILAAKALCKLSEPNPTTEDFQNALNACYSAIYSPELASGKCPVTVMAAHKFKRGQ